MVIIITDRARSVDPVPQDHIFHEGQMYRRCSDVPSARADVAGSVIATAFVSEPKEVPAVSMTKGERRRQEIIDVALRLFAVNGFQSTGLISIAREVGLTHAGILHHFGTKVRLLEAVVHERDAFASLFERWFASAPGLEPIEKLVEFAEIVIDRPLVIQLMSNLVVENLDDDAPLRGYFLERDERVRSVIAERFVEAQRAGEMREDVNAMSIARGVLAFTIGANAQWLVDRDDDILMRMYAGFGRILLQQIRT